MQSPSLVLPIMTRSCASATARYDACTHDWSNRFSRTRFKLHFQRRSVVQLVPRSQLEASRADAHGETAVPPPECFSAVSSC